MSRLVAQLKPTSLRSISWLVIVVYFCVNTIQSSSSKDFSVMSRRGVPDLPSHIDSDAAMVPPSEILVKNFYSNFDYAFFTHIPPGLVGYRAGAPSPNHGFAIRLPRRRGELSVDAYYNAAGWNSLEDALTARTQAFKDQTSGETEVISRRSASLGGLRAIQYVIQSRHSSNGHTMMCAGTIAFRSAPREIGIVYELSLTTPQTAYATNKKFLRSVQQSFRLQSVPK